MLGNQTHYPDCDLAPHVECYSDYDLTPHVECYSVFILVNCNTLLYCSLDFEHESVRIFNDIKQIGVLNVDFRIFKDSWTT
jgi:hypothetical protein